MALLAGLAWGAPAHAAPPLPEPETPPPPEAAPAPAPAPASAPAPADSATTYPTPSGVTSSPFAPPANLSKNPIDVLPGDVIYPPLGDKPSSPIKWDPEWPRFSTADWIITGTGVAITLASAITPPPDKQLPSRQPRSGRTASAQDVPAGSGFDAPLPPEEPVPPPPEAYGIAPDPLIDLRNRRSWNEGPPRTFVATTLDVGWVGVVAEILEVRGSFVPTVVSPDHIGLIGGDFTELGFRYRWATE